MRGINYFFWVCLLVCQGSCDGDNFYQTKALMKSGECIAPTYPMVFAPLLLEDSLQNFVYVLQVKFPTDTTTYHFLVDTGSPTVLSKRLAQKLAIAPLYTFIDYSIETHPRFAIGVIPQLTSGQVHWKQIATVIADTLPIEYDGILGANLLQHGIWEFDSQAKKITLHKQCPPIQNYIQLPFVRNIYRVPKIHAFFNQFKQKQLFHVSTGFSKGVKIPLTEWKRSGWLGFDSLHHTVAVNDSYFVNYLVEQEKQLVNGYKDSTYQVVLPRLQLDTATFYQLSAYFGQGTAWHIGNECWQATWLIVDWKERKLYIKKK